MATLYDAVILCSLSGAVVRELVGVTEEEFEFECDEVWGSTFEIEVLNQHCDSDVCTCCD